MNTQVNPQTKTLQKITVQQDICIEFYSLNFVAKEDNKINNGLEGKPKTIPNISEIFKIFETEAVNFEITRSKGRYEHTIEKIRFQKRSIELLVSCNDTQHQGIVKKHRKSKQRTSVPFLIDEGNETVSHIVIRFDHENETLGTVFFERVQGITLKVVENIVNKLLEKLRKEGNYAHLFQEPYVSDNKTPYFFKIEADFQPIADKEIIERLKTGDFLDLRIVEKDIEQPQHELPILKMQETHNIFKPTNISVENLSLKGLVSGLVKLGRARKKSNNEIPLTYIAKYQINHYSNL
ncbi:MULTISPECIES: hypothetical protein [unclassified Acinetobacter]|uniref:hypothetical protein n=1 Tax=unclassified Acinetobacter TaxID=196816 RepID=UPI0015D3B69E|nr:MULTISPECIES: hypothetical protein [unclassified Acinetobacter]